MAHRNDRLFKDFLRNVLHSLAIRWAPTADERTAAVDFFEVRGAKWRSWGLWLCGGMSVEVTLLGLLCFLHMSHSPCHDARFASSPMQAYFADGDPLATDFAAPTADVYATSAPASLRGVPATMVSSGSAGSGLSPAAATGPGSEGPVPGAEGSARFISFLCACVRVRMCVFELTLQA